MRISTKGHYGLRSLIDVALNQDRGPVTLNDIATRQKVSVKYLWQVINPLRVSGFLHVTRGAKGGYILAKSMEEINMLDVLTTLEGPISIIRCLTDESICKHTHACTARSIWSEVNKSAKEALAGITLKTVLDQHAIASETPDYAI